MNICAVYGFIASWLFAETVLRISFYFLCSFGITNKLFICILAILASNCIRCNFSRSFKAFLCVNDCFNESWGLALVHAKNDFKYKCLAHLIMPVNELRCRLMNTTECFFSFIYRL